MRTTRKTLATCVGVRNSERQAERLMDHEEYRWSYMTADQMYARLKRITKPEKLRNFISLARRHGEDGLATAASHKLRMLG